MPHALQVFARVPLHGSSGAANSAPVQGSNRFLRETQAVGPLEARLAPSLTARSFRCIKLRRYRPGRRSQSRLARLVSHGAIRVVVFAPCRAPAVFAFYSARPLPLLCEARPSPSATGRLAGRKRKQKSSEGVKRPGRPGQSRVAFVLSDTRTLFRDARV